MKVQIESRLQLTGLPHTDNDIREQFITIMNFLIDNSFNFVKDITIDYPYFFVYKGGSHIAIHQRENKDDWNPKTRILLAHD